MRQVYVTAVSTDSYIPGVLALDLNIRKMCKHPLLVLAANDLSKDSYEKMRSRNIKFTTAEHIKVAEDMLQATKQHAWFAHWEKTLFKLRIFDLIEYDKLVFVDCDMMLLEPIDEVFEWPHMSAVISAKSYPGNQHFKDLNSGFMVIEPRKGLSDDMAALIPQVAAEKRVFGDQDVIQAYFADWKDKPELALPEKYNVWFPHYQFYAKSGAVKALHFVNRTKPWMMRTCDVMREYIRCLFKGNRQGIAILRKYRKLIKEAMHE